VALRSWVLLATAAVVPLMLATACSGSGNAGGPAAPAAAASPGGGIPSGPAPGAQSLSEAGSTLLAPLMNLWVQAYEHQYPDVHITTAPIGSGKGIAAASAGKVDIGASDAFLSSGQTVQDPRLLNIPLAVSAQQVIYNLPGVPNLKLSGRVLAEMYQGAITKWNDPRIQALNQGARLPHTPVVPVHRSDHSGDTFLFTSYLSAHDIVWSKSTSYGTSVAWPAPIAGAPTATSNSGMVQVCKATRGCVAYIGIDYSQGATADGLETAMLQNALNQWVQPTPASIDTAVGTFVSSTPPDETISMINGPASGGYPIVNYEYAIVSTTQPTPAKARDIKAFLHWAITAPAAASRLSQVQFQPLPKPIVSLSDAQIAKIG